MRELSLEIAMTDLSLMNNLFTGVVHRKNKIEKLHNLIVKESSATIVKSCFKVTIPVATWLRKRIGHEEQIRVTIRLENPSKQNNSV